MRVCLYVVAPEMVVVMLIPHFRRNLRIVKLGLLSSLILRLCVLVIDCDLLHQSVFESVELV